MRLFVYGIFLGEGMREAYGMTSRGYATVKDYITVGEHIVQARRVDPEMNAALTGLVVDVPPTMPRPYGASGVVDNIKRLDELETGYDRVMVHTTSGQECQMYVERERSEDRQRESHITSSRRS